MSEKDKESQQQDKTRQLLDSTPLTGSLPLTFTYYIAANTVSCCEKAHVDGHAVKLTKDSYIVYLKDQRPTFNISQQDLLHHDSFQVHCPELIVSSAEKEKLTDGNFVRQK